MQGLVSRAQELAVQGANDSQNADARAAIAIEVRGIFQAMVAAANVRAEDGEFLLAGTKGDAAAFDSSGVYQGDGETRQVDFGDGLLLDVSETGTFLTAASGQDVFVALDSLATALESNDLAGVQQGAEDMGQAVRQVSMAAASIGSAHAAIISVDDARIDLEVAYATTVNRLAAADTVESATELAAATTLLEVTQATLAKIISSTRPLLR